MRPRPRRSSNAARPSSASGGCAIALSPTASRKPATACPPSHGCRQVSGEAREQRTRSSVCTKSSSGGSRRRPCCRRQKRQRCCSGRCSPLVRSTCARLMVGRRSPQSPSINRLTSPPDQILSKCRRSRHQIPTPLATAPGRTLESNETRMVAPLSELTEQAMRLHEEGRLAQAEALYRQILTAEPHHFDAQHLLGMLCLQQGRTEEALVLVIAALQARPNDPHALSTYGVVLHKLRRYEEAVAICDEALIAWPDFPDALVNRGIAL